MQLVILNFSNFVGRLVAGFIGQALGVATVSALATAACAAVTLGMISLKDVIGVVFVGILFGFFWGVCECFHRCLVPVKRSSLCGQDIALNSPVVIALTDDFSEIGYALCT